MKQSIILVCIVVTLLVILQSTFTIGQLLKSEQEYLAVQQEINDQQVKRHAENMAKFQSNMCRCNSQTEEIKALNRASHTSTAYSYRYRWIGFWMPTDQTAMATYSDMICHR